jgi:iron-regulated transporter 1
MAAPWRDYITSPVFLASFALSLLYLTVLSFAPQMITYLLHTGFSPLQVSCMRIGAVISELAGTWAAPMAMHRIGPVRAGLWFINWQFGCLAAAAAGFILFDDSSSNSRLVAVSLIVGVALSRVGLWGFDLSVQYLVQEVSSSNKFQIPIPVQGWTGLLANQTQGTTPASRARFSSTEMALQNIFELVSFMITIVFPRPEQFKYPVLISYGAIGVASVSYAVYVRKERGHLVHLSKLCFGRNGDDKMSFLSVLRRSGRRNGGYEHLV